MKRTLPTSALKFLLLILCSYFLSTTAKADVTLTSSAVTAATVNQGTSNIIAYAVKMDVTLTPVTVNNIQFTLGGTFDNNDLSFVGVSFNATAPSLSGATPLANLGGAFTAPHLYSVAISQAIAAGGSGYFIIYFNLSPTATSGNTVKINGATNPVVFGFSAAQTLTNNQSDIGGTQTIGAASINLTSTPVAASNIAQGFSGSTIAYIVKLDVTGQPVTVNNIQFTLGGTYDNNDLSLVNVFFNATAPSLTGATIVSNLGGGFTPPHVYSTALNTPIAAGGSGYYIITFIISPTATAGNTVKVDGLANPVIFSFATGPTITNNQTDVAGVQTFIGGAVTLSSSPVAASNVVQGFSGSTIAYIVKMDAIGQPVTVNNIQFTLGGSFDNNDLSLVSVYFNATAPSLTGASVVSNLGGGFTPPHTYSTALNIPIAAGSSGYFIITFTISPTATAGNTVKVDGLANPVVFSFLTGPTITNNQTDVAGVQTFVGGAVALSSSPVAASNVAQGSNTNTIAYIVKLDATGQPVTVNNIQFTLGGTFDNNDLSLVSVYFNATAPSLTGASVMSNIGGGFAAPHTFSTAISNSIAAGSSGYFIITFNLSSSATAGNTVKVDGLANPVVFSYLTGPTVTNNQTDAAGVQTFIGATVTLTTSAVAASNVAQGASNTIAYIAKMDVTGLPVSINSLNVTLGGTHDNNDLVTVSVWFNATAPSLTGASNLNGLSATFAAPHTYTIPFSQTIAAGASGYFIITFVTAASATAGNTVKVDGVANPVTFSFLSSPAIVNNQTDIGGIQTILAAGVTLSSPAIPAANIVQGSSNNLIYATKMDVTNLPVTTNSIQFTLSGTHDNNDLTQVAVWFNPTAPTMSGATGLISATATFAAPHTYSISISNTIAAGGSGYYLITASLSPTATGGNTVLLNGAVNPVVFGFTTVPPVSNNQANNAGTQTFVSSLPLTLTSFTGSIANRQQALLQWETASEMNTRDFEIEWSSDGITYKTIANIPAAFNSNQARQYKYVHKLPGDGNNFYRLKMNDIDRRFTYSTVVKLRVAIITTSVTVFPNPVTDIMQLQIQSEKNQRIELVMRSADGRTIASQSFDVVKGINKVSWSMSQLATGNYFITSANNSFETVKIIKQ